MLAALSVIGGAGAASASAEGLDWAVNGVPVPEGKKIAVTVEALTQTTFASKEGGIEIVCGAFKGSGTFVGGKEGTGAVKMVWSKCAIPTEKKCHVIGPVGVPRWFIDFGPRFGAPGFTASYMIQHEYNPFRVRQCGPERQYKPEGVVDGEVPEGNEEELIDPTPALETSSFTLNGHPGISIGKYRIKLTKGGKFGYAHV